MNHTTDRIHPKIGFSTLAQALSARSSIAQNRGKRFRRLRLYRQNGSWFLTKMTRSQQEDVE
jgi:hypothetical protein